MTVATDVSRRTSAHANLALEDRFEVLKEIGDGSFGNVVLARVRTAGASVARRGTVVSTQTADRLQRPQTYTDSMLTAIAGRHQIHEEDV